MNIKSIIKHKEPSLLCEYLHFSIIERILESPSEAGWSSETQLLQLLYLRD